MVKSKVELCNVSLGLLGASPIRDFVEDNKRARQCELFYDVTREELLSKFDWTFARKLCKLNQVVIEMPIAATDRAFQLPADCLTPRNIEPIGTRFRWTIFGSVLVTDKVGDVILRYTRLEDNVIMYPSTFRNLLIAGTAVKMCMSITQDKALFRSLVEAYDNMKAELHEVDANIGNEYLTYDNDYNNDSYVAVGGNFITHGRSIKSQSDY